MCRMLRFISDYRLHLLIFSIQSKYIIGKSTANRNSKLHIMLSCAQHFLLFWREVSFLFFQLHFFGAVDGFWAERERPRQRERERSPTPHSSFLNPVFFLLHLFAVAFAQWWCNYVDHRWGVGLHRIS